MKNAIEVSKYKYNIKIGEEYRRKLGLTGECVIGNVARLEYGKNQEFLFELFYNIYRNHSKDGRSFKLLFVGSGHKEEEYKNIVREKGLGDHVIFTGQRSDVPELLQVMDIFCLPSRFEGLPFALVEAQASELPCIASNLITEEVVINDDVVLLPLDIGLWKEKILEYTEEKTMRGNKKVKLKQKGYDIEDQIKEVQKEYAKGLVNMD